jgi:hypothetical protein
MVTKKQASARKEFAALARKGTGKFGKAAKSTGAPKPKKRDDPDFFGGRHLSAQ